MEKFFAKRGEKQHKSGKKKVVSRRRLRIKSRRSPRNRLGEGQGVGQEKDKV